jgi:hypothetical protein
MGESEMTNKTTKLQVTAEQKKALDTYVEYAGRSLREYENHRHGWQDSYIPLKTLSFDDMATALYVGYEIKKPTLSISHQAVKDYFDVLVDREDMTERSGVHGGQHRQGWQSVKHTLNLLGIQIEGVNGK